MDNDDPGRRDGRAHRWGRGIASAATIAGAMAAPTVLAAEVERVEFASAEQTYTPAGTPGVIEIEVVFDAAVEVAGAPVFDLMVGTERRRMAYASGTGTARLLFEYAVRKGDLDEDGVGYPANALSGGTIRDGDGEPVDRRFRALPRAPGHTVDGIAPRAVSLQVVSNPARRGTYALREQIFLALAFDEEVDGEETGASLALDLDGVGRRAVRRSVVGDTLRFSYRVAEGDEDADGFVVPSRPFTVTDRHGNVARRSTPALRSPQKVDGVRPRIAGTAIVSNPGADGTYGRGDAIIVEVAFSEPVDARGSAFTLLLGAQDGPGNGLRTARYRSGHGTDRVRYRYVVRAGDRDSDGISYDAEALSGITDRVHNTLRGRVRAVTAQTGHRVDAGEDNESPVVTDVSFTSRPVRADTYAAGQDIQLRVAFNEPVSVASPSALALELAVGNRTRRAAFVRARNNAPAEVLRFRYTVRERDVDTDGIAVASIAESLVGGTIEDPSGNTAIRDFPALPAQRRHKVDGIAPAVRDVAITSDAGPDSTYAVGDEIEVGVDFSEPVVAGHAPELRLELVIGDRVAPADLVAGEETRRLTFRYRVREGDVDANGVSIGAAALAGGAVEDLAGNAADAEQPRLALRNQRAHRVDAATTAHGTVVVLSSAGRDNTYALDDPIEVQVRYAEDVVVSGTVELVLSLGPNDSPGANLKRRAPLVRRTPRRLTFEYRVQAGDLDPDGFVVDAHALDGGTVEDAFGNPARLLTPFTSDEHRVDGIVPAVAGIEIVSDAGDDDTYEFGEDIEFEVSFSEVVHTNNVLTLVVQIGDEARHAAFVDGAGTRTLRFRYTVVSSDFDDDGISVRGRALSCGGGEGSFGCITDNAGNAVAEPIDGLAAQPRHKVDAAVAGVERVAIVSDAGEDLTYVPGDVVRVRATFSDPVHVAGGSDEPVLALSIGAASRPAAFAGGSGTRNLLFEYTVVEGDHDGDGISIAANALTGGTIQDDSGNPVDRTFAAVPAQSDHRVGTETSLLLLAQTLPIGRDLVVDLAGTLEEGGILYAGPFAATSDDPAIADVRTAGAFLFVVPRSEGEATIEIRTRRAPIILVLPVTVVTSEAETAVLQSSLAAVARGLLGTAADTIGARLELAGMPAGGQGLHRSGPSTQYADPDTFDVPPVGFGDSVGGGPGQPRPYRPTSFAVPLAGGQNGGTSWGAWGAAAYKAFEGTPDAGSYDGDLTSFHLGADARADGWVAGASLSRTQASVAYAYDGDATGAGTLDTELTALHPYVQWRPAPGTTVWTILGFGAGEATAQREGQPVAGEPATLGMRLGLAGLRMDLGDQGGVSLALRGDAGFVQLETEDGLRAVDGLSVQAQRVRAGVEASRPMPTATGVLSPFVEIGARWDGGDGEAGGGIEVAGGVRYRGPNGGFEVKARTLAMHGGAGVAEHGIAATAFIEPGPQGTGLRLSLTPRWGAPEFRDVFRQSDYAMRGMHHDPGSRRFMLDGRIGYGLALRGRPGTLEPFGAVGGSPQSDSRVRLGVRYGPGGRHGTSRYEVSTERVAGMGRVDYRMLLVAEARF